MPEMNRAGLASFLIIVPSPRIHGLRKQISENWGAKLAQV
jgi:hypothetical protein